MGTPNSSANAGDAGPPTSFSVCSDTATTQASSRTGRRRQPRSLVAASASGIGAIHARAATPARFPASATQTTPARTSAQVGARPAGGFASAVSSGGGANGLFGW